MLGFRIGKGKRLDGGGRDNVRDKTKAMNGENLIPSAIQTSHSELIVDSEVLFHEW